MATFGFQAGVGTSVATGELEDGSVTVDKLASDAVTNVKVAAAAAIAYSKLALTGEILNADLAGSIADSKLNQIATASKVSGAALTSLANIPAGAGVIPSANLPGGGNLIEADPTEITVGNSTTETTLFDVSIPANTLLTGKAIKFKAFLSNFSMAAANATLKLKYGATTIATATVTTNVDFSGAKGFIEGYLVADGASSAQKGMVMFLASDSAGESAADASVGFDKIMGWGNGSGVEDATGALTLSITWQWGSQEVGSTITAEFWVVEKIS